jgi:arylsulfatase
MISIGGTPHLYHLASDPQEDHDIAAQHPDIVRELVAIARSQHTDSPHFPVTMPEPDDRGDSLIKKVRPDQIGP